MPRRNSSRSTRSNMANTEPGQALDRSRKGYAQTPFLQWRNQALLPTFPAAKEFLFRVALPFGDDAGTRCVWTSRAHAETKAVGGRRCACESPGSCASSRGAQPGVLSPGVLSPGVLSARYSSAQPSKTGSAAARSRQKTFRIIGSYG